MREYSGFSRMDVWLFPGRLPKDCFLPPECRRENRDLRIPRRMEEQSVQDFRWLH